MFERLRKRVFRRLCPRLSRSAPLATRQGQSPHGRSRFKSSFDRLELGMLASLGYGPRRTVDEMESEAWAKMAVHHLEELEAERIALERGDACVVDGDQSSRLAAIAADVDMIYARLDLRAEQLAAHAGVASKAPLPPPPPPRSRPKSSATTGVEQTLRGMSRLASPEKAGCKTEQYEFSRDESPSRKRASEEDLSAGAASGPKSGYRAPSDEKAFAELASAQLASAELASAELASAELASAQLASAQLASAQLASAELASAELASAELASAELASAELASAELAPIESPSLRGASGQLASARQSLIEQRSKELAEFVLELENMDTNEEVIEVETVNIDTVVVQHPEEESTKLKNPPKESPEEWLSDERLELKETLAAMRQDREKSSQAFSEATRALVGQTQALDRLASQAEAAQAALERFQLAKDSVEAQVAAAREAVQLQRAQERQASLALAAMEARVRSESKLLLSLDRIRARIGSVQAALDSARSSAEQEKVTLSRNVEASLLAAEKATRQAEEMRDAAERAHQRAQQAIAQAQEVETQSERREQELRQVVDGLESQISGLRHEEDGVNQQLSEIRSAKAQVEVARTPRRTVAPQLPEDADAALESLNPPN